MQLLYDIGLIIFISVYLCYTPHTLAVSRDPIVHLRLEPRTICQVNSQHSLNDHSRQKVIHVNSTLSTVLFIAFTPKRERERERESIIFGVCVCMTVCIDVLFQVEYTVHDVMYNFMYNFMYLRYFSTFIMSVSLMQ